MADCVDCVVVGAGPVGLLTAIELALGGAGVLVLERLDVPSRAVKALSIGPLGSEALMRRGFAAAIATEEERNFAAMGAAGSDMRDRMLRFSGHFAGLPIRRSAQRQPERRLRFVDQQGLEAMLAARALTLGIEVRRACEVCAFAEREDGVEVEWRSPAGADGIRCAYLVGCDGGRSSVRKIAGFDFPGTPPTLTMYQAVADIDRPERLAPAGWRRTAGGVLAFGPFPRRLFMLDFSGPPADREAPVTKGEIEAALRRIGGVDVRVEALESANRWTDNTRLVGCYRGGRILLAGDAAHVHAPFGGQGLSLGLVDAANLGWKLAAVLRGGMPDSLLDSYTAERRPVAEGVLANTLAQVAIMRPDPQSGAMRDIVADLMRFDDVNRRIGETMSGLATRYDLGSDRDDVGRLIGDLSVRRGGEAVPLHDVMQDGCGVFLDASAERAGASLVASIPGKIHAVTVDTGPSMLIRPDGCVAWAGEENEVDGLEDALRRWFPPTRDDRPASLRPSR